MEGTELRPHGAIEKQLKSRPRSRHPTARRGERLLVTGLVASAIVVLAVRGGAYDVIPRGEFALTVWWAVGLGAALGLLPRRKPTREGLVAAVAMAAMVAWTAFAFLWTESDERTSLELARVTGYAGVLFLVTMCLRPSTVGAAIAGVSIACSAVCVLALASRLWPASFPIDRVSESLSPTRLSYPLNYWNAVAAWGSIATALSLAWSVHARNAVMRALALAVVPVCVTVVYLTYSRAGVAGIAVGAVGGLVLARTRLVFLAHLAAAAGASALAIVAVRGARPIANATGSGGRDDVLVALFVGALICAAVAIALHAARADERLRLPRRIGRPAVVASVVLGVVVGGVALSPVIDRGLEEFNNDDSIVEKAADPSERLTSGAGNRKNLWESALAAYRSDRLTGTGPGTFEFWWNRDGRDPEHVRDAHSLFVESLAEGGTVGFLTTVALCLALLAALVRFRTRARGRAQTGAAAAGLAGFAVWVFHAGVDWMWEETAVTTVAIVLGGAGCAALAFRPLPPHPGLRAGLSVVAVAAILVQLPVLLGTAAVRESERAVARGDGAAAVEAADDAVRVWPGAAAPYAARGRAEAALGRLAAARADVEQARRREPTNWRHPLLAARLAAQDGRAREAIAAFRDAASLRPLGTVFR